MTANQTLIPIAAVLTLAAAAMPAAHANTSAEGVKCPANTSAKLSNNGTDKCFIEKEVFGNRVRVNGQFTIPDGLTGLLGNPESHGWDLKRDHDGSTDYWSKEAKDYRFPNN